MATVTLNSRITIGNFQPFRGVHEVSIKKSLGSHLDTAMIKLPATARLRRVGSAPVSVDTAKQFKRGDKVTIELGYNGDLQTEFEGFINRVNMRTPCELECEGYAWQLKNKTVNKVWKNTNLRNVLTEVVSDTDITLGDVDDIPFSVIQLIKESGFKSLELVKKMCGEVINIWFEGKTMHAGYKYTFYTERQSAGKADVLYRIGHNTVDDRDMKQRELGDTRVEIEFYNKKKDGDRVTATAGVPNSNYQQKKLQAIVDRLALKKAADNAEAVKNYAGFEGKIVTFLQPYCRPGYKIRIEDGRYPERSGNYLVEEVETVFGTRGAKRNVEISFKL